MYFKAEYNGAKELFLPHKLEVVVEAPERGIDQFHACKYQTKCIVFHTFLADKDIAGNEQHDGQQRPRARAARDTDGALSREDRSCH